MQTTSDSNIGPWDNQQNNYHTATNPAKNVNNKLHNAQNFDMDVDMYVNMHVQPHLKDHGQPSFFVHQESQCKYNGNVQNMSRKSKAKNRQYQNSRDCMSHNLIKYNSKNKCTVYTTKNLSHHKLEQSQKPYFNEHVSIDNNQWVGDGNNGSINQKQNESCGSVSIDNVIAKLNRKYKSRVRSVKNILVELQQQYNKQLQHRYSECSQSKYENRKVNSINKGSNVKYGCTSNSRRKLEDISKGKCLNIIRQKYRVQQMQADDREYIHNFISCKQIHSPTLKPPHNFNIRTSTDCNYQVGASHDNPLANGNDLLTCCDDNATGKFIPYRQQAYHQPTYSAQNEEHKNNNNSSVNTSNNHAALIADTRQNKLKCKQRSQISLYKKIKKQINQNRLELNVAEKESYTKRTAQMAHIKEINTSSNKLQDKAAMKQAITKHQQKQKLPRILTQFNYQKQFSSLCENNRHSVLVKFKVNKEKQKQRIRKADKQNINNKQNINKSKQKLKIIQQPSNSLFNKGLSNSNINMQQNKDKNIYKHRKNSKQIVRKTISSYKNIGFSHKQHGNQPAHQSESLTYNKNMKKYRLFQSICSDAEISPNNNRTSVVQKKSQSQKIIQMKKNKVSKIIQLICLDQSEYNKANHLHN